MQRSTGSPGSAEAARAVLQGRCGPVCDQVPCEHLPCACFRRYPIKATRLLHPATLLLHRSLQLVSKSSQQGCRTRSDLRDPSDPSVSRFSGSTANAKAVCRVIANCADAQTAVVQQGQRSNRRDRLQATQCVTTCAALTASPGHSHCAFSPSHKMAGPRTSPLGSSKTRLHPITCLPSARKTEIKSTVAASRSALPVHSQARANWSDYAGQPLRKGSTGISAQ